MHYNILQIALHQRFKGDQSSQINKTVLDKVNKWAFRVFRVAPGSKFSNFAPVRHLVIGVAHPSTGAEAQVMCPRCVKVCVVKCILDAPNCWRNFAQKQLNAAAVWS